MCTTSVLKSALFLLLTKLKPGGHTQKTSIVCHIQILGLSDMSPG